LDKKLLVVGLDGATFNLILPWVDHGELPNFKRLMEQGVWGELLSTKPPITSPAWPAFMTGKNPGKFGVGDFMINHTGTERVANFSDIKAETFWDIAGRQGLCSIILNVPMTYPARISKGILLSGMLTPQGAPFWSDKEVIEDIRKNVGDYKVDLDMLTLSSLQNSRSLRKLYDITEMRFKTIKYLLDKYPFDLAVVVFQLTDIICHRLWHRKDEILKAYKKVDEYLRWFAEQKEHNLFILSDHGFGEFSRRIRINQYLLEMGFLKKRKASSRDGVTQGSSEIQDLRFGGRKSLAQQIFRSSKGLFLAINISRSDIENILRKAGMLKAVKKYSPNVLKRFLPPSKHQVDYAGSMAYLHSSRTRCISINRDHLPTNSAYVSFRSQIKEKLMDLKDPQTGMNVISQVYLKEEIYHGEYINLMPDIYLEPAEGYLIRSGFGESVIDSFAMAKSQHESAGILIAKGPDIRNGSSTSNASIIDLAPTFLHLMGLAIPEDMDGEVLFDLFKKDSEIHEREIAFTPPVDTGDIEAVNLSVEQEELIRERLRGLGYID
jgi:predicted AlkP superfamily phosphohydrolase/phosphomutase